LPIEIPPEGFQTECHDDSQQATSQNPQFVVTKEENVEFLGTVNNNETISGDGHEKNSFSYDESNAEENIGGR
jgi:hypothetical protein